MPSHRYTRPAARLLPLRLLAPLLTTALLLGGCAGQMAYRDGNELIAKNQTASPVR